jgi:hypothetical protein
MGLSLGGPTGAIAFNPLLEGFHVDSDDSKSKPIGHAVACKNASTRDSKRRLIPIVGEISCVDTGSRLHSASH